MSCCRIVVRQDVRSVRVASPGPQGPQGPPGPPGPPGEGFGGTFVASVNGRSGTVELGVTDIGTVNAARLLGRRLGSAGSAEEITLGTGLKMSSTGQLTANLQQVASAEVQVLAGTGLTGGGDLTVDRSFAVDFATGGTAATGKAVEATDSRLADARTPTTHKATHATGGSDAIAPADIGAANASHTHAAGDIASGTIDIARIPTGATSSTVSLGNHKHDASDLTSGTLGLARGGTGSNLSATGGSRQFLKQNGAGAAVTVGTITASDLPSHTHSTSDLASGLLAVARGGTAADLTATGGSGQVLKQSTAGGPVTVAALTVGELAQSGAGTGDVLKWNGAAWAPGSASGAGTVTSVTAGTGLTGGTITGSGTIAVDFHASGSSAKAVRADDERLGDARTPTAHVHAVGDLTQSGATANQVLAWNGSAWAPATPTGGGGGTRTYCAFQAIDGIAPESSAATLDTQPRTGAGEYSVIPVLEFDPSSAEYVTFQGVIPEGVTSPSASTGGGLKVIVWWIGTATGSNVTWKCRFENIGSGVATGGTATESFAAASSASSPAPSTVGVTTSTVITVPYGNTDSLAAGDPFVLQVQRDPADASDGNTGDAQLVMVEVRGA